MTSTELAEFLQALTIRECEEADGAPDNPGRVLLRAAVTAAKTSLGDQAPRGWQAHLRTGLTEGIHRDLADLNEMRSILLKTSFGNELRASGADLAPICFLLGGDPNARAFAAPDGKPVVQMEVALQTWLIFFNRLLIRCAEKDTDKKARKKQFLQMIKPWTEACFGLNGSSSASESVSQAFVETCSEPFGLLMSTIITEWQKLFVLAHELAHVSLGHLSDAIPKHVNIGGEECDLSYYVRSQQQEYAADKRAMEYVLAVLEYVSRNPDVKAVVYPEPIASATPCVFFMHLSYLEMLRWRPGRKSLNTHPMAKSRCESIFPLCEDIVWQSGQGFALFQLAQEMIMKASYQVFDQLGLPRPGDLPPEYEINWSLGDRID